MTKQRVTSDSFVAQSPQSIGSVHKPGSGHFYMKPQGPPDLNSAGGFTGVGLPTDKLSLAPNMGAGRSAVSRGHYSVGRDRFVAHPHAVAVTDDSMGHLMDLTTDGLGHPDERVGVKYPGKK